MIHACRHPCYLRAASGTGRPRVIETANDLFLDLIDLPEPSFDLLPFLGFLAFAGRHWASGSNLLVHCNRGLSRAPSLALLFLAKRRAAISAASFEAAHCDFAKIFPGYAPGEGIRRFLMDRWEEL